jgi:hypothetical protein
MLDGRLPFSDIHMVLVGKLNECPVYNMLTLKEWMIFEEVL